MTSRSVVRKVAVVRRAFGTTVCNEALLSHSCNFLLGVILAQGGLTEAIYMTFGVFPINLAVHDSMITFRSAAQVLHAVQKCGAVSRHTS